MDSVVSFGKYAGASVETLARDRQYVDWLFAQPWFREQHAPLYRRLRRDLGMPGETPVHNQLQARFMDPVFRKAFVALTTRGAFEAPAAQRLQFEEGGFDVLLRYSDRVRVGQRSGVGTVSYYVECKPVVGDDYPAVLRQMKRVSLRNLESAGEDGEVNYKVLLLGAYTGLLSFKDLRAIFRLDHIHIIFAEHVIDVMNGACAFYTGSTDDCV